MVCEVARKLVTKYEWLYTPEIGQQELKVCEKLQKKFIDQNNRRVNLL